MQNSFLKHNKSREEYVRHIDVFKHQLLLKCFADILWEYWVLHILHTILGTRFYYYRLNFNWPFYPHELDPLDGSATLMKSIFESQLLKVLFFHTVIHLMWNVCPHLLVLVRCDSYKSSFREGEAQVTARVVRVTGVWRLDNV